MVCFEWRITTKAQKVSFFLNGNAGQISTFFLQPRISPEASAFNHLQYTSAAGHICSSGLPRQPAELITSAWPGWRRCGGTGSGRGSVPDPQVQHLCLQVNGCRPLNRNMSGMWMAGDMKSQQKEEEGGRKETTAQGEGKFYLSCLKGNRSCSVATQLKCNPPCARLRDVGRREGAVRKERDLLVPPLEATSATCYLAFPDTQFGLLGPATGGGSCRAALHRDPR